MKYPVQKRYHSFAEKRKRDRAKRPPINPRIAVPSFFTLMNLFSGFLSIISVADGNLVLGAWLIAIAGLFDVLDGFMARLANADSDFGIELDSLSDMVSFGVAPGFLIYTFSLYQLGNVGVLISAIPPLCGAVRLARFNVNARLSPTSEHFIGLPIPALAIILGAFFLTFRNDLDLFSNFDYGVNSIIIPIVILLSFLMVSTIKFDKIPRFDRKSIKEKKWQFALFLSYFLLIIFFQDYGMIAVFFIFIVKGLVNAAIHFFKDDYDPNEVETFENFS